MHDTPRRAKYREREEVEFYEAHDLPDKTNTKCKIFFLELSLIMAMISYARRTPPESYLLTP